jgi:flagellin-like protein
MTIDYMMKMKKKGISPVIATVLLVAMVVVIGLIIFLWAKGFQEEAVTKFGGENIEITCGRVSFEADYSQSRTLSLSNLGNVPIFGINAKIYEDGSHETKDLGEISNWPDVGLLQGATFSGNMGTSLDAEKVVLIPILIGTSDRGSQIHICGDEFGKEIQVV